MSVRLILVALCALPLLSVAQPTWQQQGVPKAADEGLVPPPTAAKWLWTADEALKAGGVSYFRRPFVLSKPVRTSRACFKADDLGTLFLNGRRVGVDDFGKFAVVGTNVLAVFIRNVGGPGGFIFRADLDCEDGEKLAIVSDGSFCSAAKAPPAWEQPSFDDSAWKSAAEQGDASLSPWADQSDIAWEFASKEEYAAILAWRDGLLPASLTAEPDPEVRVVYRNGLPFVNVNGRDYPPYLNLAGVKSRFARSAVLKTAALGFPFFELQFEDYEIERAPGVYDFTPVDKAARMLLRLVPDAYVFLRFRTNFPKWCAVHREAWIGYGNGPVDPKIDEEHEGRTVRPSAASPEYRAELTRFHDRLGEFVRSQLWSKRVVAFRSCWGVFSEWHTYGFHQCPDTGAAMTAAFRRYKGCRYAQDNPPTPDEVRRLEFLLDPVRDAKALDFFQCVREETLALQVQMARDLKRNFPGRLVGSYSGYVFTSYPSVGQNCWYEALMNAPEIDFCSNPASYSKDARLPGGSFMQRALPDAFCRHGKLLLLEDDMRFHHVKDWDLKQAHTETSAESAAAMRRDFLLTLFDGCGIQLCDPFNGVGRRPNAFDDPSILGAMHETIAALGRVGPAGAGSGNEVLVLVDPQLRYRWSADSARHSSTFRLLSTELPQRLHTCGVPADIADVRDYLAGNDDKHRIVCVVDAFTLSASESAELVRRLKRPELSAFRLKVAGLPELLPELEAVDAPASAEEWRELLVRRGAHAWAQPGSFLRRRGNLVGVSVASAGSHCLSLPASYGAVREMYSGRRLPGSKVTYETKGPDTLLFYLEEGTKPLP